MPTKASKAQADMNYVASYCPSTLAVSMKLSLIAYTYSINRLNAIVRPCLVTLCLLCLLALASCILG
ncbi:hypothetical protein LY78DRAFT_18312 [Colletotrichum sublineola]|nr:hypothetical protein LY78DRAFT_18312 [Colletotrichum sublineola]